MNTHICNETCRDSLNNLHNDGIWCCSIWSQQEEIDNIDEEKKIQEQDIIDDINNETSLDNYLTR